HHAWMPPGRSSSAALTSALFRSPSSVSLSLSMIPSNEQSSRYPWTTANKQIYSYLAGCLPSLARANPGETKPAILSSEKWPSTSLRNLWGDGVFEQRLAEMLLQILSCM